MLLINLFLVIVASFPDHLTAPPTLLDPALFFVNVLPVKVIFAPSMYAAPPDDFATFSVNSLFLMFALFDFISNAPASFSAVLLMNLLPVTVADGPVMYAAPALSPALLMRILLLIILLELPSMYIAPPLVFVLLFVISLSEIMEFDPLTFMLPPAPSVALLSSKVFLEMLNPEATAYIAPPLLASFPSNLFAAIVPEFELAPFHLIAPPSVSA